ncbi:MAG TPA: c-type cytochrome domain-containing protein [Bryobacterales bacterium]|nr:c-type cytochrome domain-containing protein [Bryobacterales bacterium]
MRYCGLVLLFAFGIGVASAEVSYYKDLRPILERSCQGCHQPAGKMGGLDLTSYEAMAAGGSKGPAFVAGSADESRLVMLLTGAGEPRMPFGQDPLPDTEIDVFRRWVSEGAKDDTPESARGPQVPTEPPTYDQPPVLTAAAFSPDGKALAVGGYREILLHKADGSKIETRLLGRSDRIHSVAFTPDGKKLVAVGGTPGRFGEVQIWDLASKKQLHSVVATNDTLFGGALSPDGSHVVVGGADNGVRVIEIATGKELFKAGHHEDWVLDAAFGIDGKRVVTVGRDRAAKLADAATGAFLENVNFLRDELHVIARHPRRDYVLIGGMDRVPYLYMMDRPRALKIADDSTLVRKFAEQEGAIHALSFSSDGSRIAVGGIAEVINIYDTESGERVASCKLPAGGAYVLEFPPDGRQLLAGGFDGLLRVFDVASGKQVKEFSPVPLERGRLRSAR